jgi:hypothetical protein
MPKSQHSNTLAKSDYDLLLSPKDFRQWAEAESLETLITEIELRQTKVTGPHGDVLSVDSTIKIVLDAGAVLEIELVLNGRDKTSGAYLITVSRGASVPLSGLGSPHYWYLYRVSFRFCNTSWYHQASRTLFAQLSPSLHYYWQ